MPRYAPQINGSIREKVIFMDAIDVILEVLGYCELTEAASGAPVLTP
jgi:hypothetical protein